MKLSDELIELRRNFQIKKIEEKNPNYFTNLRNELKSHAEKGKDRYSVNIDALPKDVTMSMVEEWTELNGMEFVWETPRHPFRICF
jgi:hypothetical protein